MREHPDYADLVAKAKRSHERHRSPHEIEPADVARARLYAYAFRLHTIGTFHATQTSLAGHAPAGPLAESLRQRAVEALQDLANQAMEPVSDDFRVVVSTLYRYHVHVNRVADSLTRECTTSGDSALRAIGDRFRRIIEEITSGNGIHVMRDVSAPEQASFVVPNLGIVIVPLVYGDFHSWNLAYLAGQARNVPTHRHRAGVEIHLGYNPTHGVTVLGSRRAKVDEGYAMPIPPGTDHGWVNTTTETHHVPFIFGSLKYGGWGVFLDVEAQPKPVDEFELVSRDSRYFSQMIYLERQLDRAAAMRSTWRSTLIPASVTDRGGSGGLELTMTRINTAPYELALGSYRIVSIARGSGLVEMAGARRNVAAHDHFGVPAGLRATLRQIGDEPLVVLDAVITSAAAGHW